ncbi:hypothetical protein CVS40_9196 [Lucilia cuprina]|nr:hypothetical protein CVS40_9196 [Lucilia cuprina]
MSLECIERTIDPQKIVIFTDSLVSCQLLQSEKHDYFYIAEIHNLIANSSLEAVEVVWTPSHVGISFNEIADEMAKNACEIGAIFEARLSPLEAIRNVREQLFNEQKEEFEQVFLEKGKWFKEVNIYISPKQFFKSKILIPEDVKTINRLMAGHSYNKIYLNLINVSPSANCEICKKVCAGYK